MCLAVPGKVVKVEEGMATIDYGSEQRVASTLLQECQKGDWVIVSAKMIMKVVPEDQALATLKVWDEADKVTQ